MGYGRRGRIGWVVIAFAGVVGPLIGGGAFGFGRPVVFAIAAALVLTPPGDLATMRRAPQATPA